MHLIGRHQADASMVVILIIPIEETAAERLGILNAAEALWKLRLVLQRLEVAFRERIVVGGAAGRVPPLWQGEAGTARLSGGQSALHQVLCVLCEPALPEETIKDVADEL